MLNYQRVILYVGILHRCNRRETPTAVAKSGRWDGVDTALVGGSQLGDPIFKAHRIYYHLVYYNLYILSEYTYVYIYIYIHMCVYMYM